MKYNFLQERHFARNKLHNRDMHSRSKKEKGIKSENVFNVNFIMTWRIFTNFEYLQHRLELFFCPKTLVQFQAFIILLNGLSSINLSSTFFSNLTEVKHEASENNKKFLLG